ncbi:hypothetical protein VitviT2T_010379 [Vitis vinifera]|uniref:Rapid ALkalinization Factor n=1 Tax=Vitis vinifera TaxID=29760 RepID=A0ABY9C7J2_VITVI|nr:hypothetical protein VitviT2T_010379 [Vitis vinifera]
MGLSITKQWVVFALLCMVLLNNVQAISIDNGVLDPCKGPKPPVGCVSDSHAPRQEANPWNRGCSKITQCRDLALNLYLHRRHQVIYFYVGIFMVVCLC